MNFFQSHSLLIVFLYLTGIRYREFYHQKQIETLTWLEVEENFEANLKGKCCPKNMLNRHTLSSQIFTSCHDTMFLFRKKNSRHVPSLPSTFR